MILESDGELHPLEIKEYLRGGFGRPALTVVVPPMSMKMVESMFMAVTPMLTAACAPLCG